MTHLFYMGGPLFMGILTILLITVTAVTIYVYLRGSNRHIPLIKEIGIFALVVGILGQFIGLYQAFQSIEMAGTVSQAILAGGLKVSSITTIYGIIIFLISWLLYSGLNYRLHSGRKESD